MGLILLESDLYYMGFAIWLGSSHVFSLGRFFDLPTGSPVSRFTICTMLHTGTFKPALGSF